MLSIPVFICERLEILSKRNKAPREGLFYLHLATRAACNSFLKASVNLSTIRLSPDIVKCWWFCRVIYLPFIFSKSMPLQGSCSGHDGHSSFGLQSGHFSFSTLAPKKEPPPNPIMATSGIKYFVSIVVKLSLCKRLKRL